MNYDQLQLEVWQTSHDDVSNGFVTKRLSITASKLSFGFQPLKDWVEFNSVCNHTSELFLNT